jgi:hypothetical protein
MLTGSCLGCGRFSLRNYRTSKLSMVWSACHPCPLCKTVSGQTYSLGLYCDRGPEQEAYATFMQDLLQCNTGPRIILV